MFLTLTGVLPPDRIDAVRTAAEALTWKPGELTAGPRARAVKKNLQADLTDARGLAVQEMLLSAVSAHPVLRAAAWPKRFSPLLLSRTEPGGGYGRHVDNALIGRDFARLRTDLSFTLFLSDPETYEGGELAIETPAGTYTAKPDAGSLVLYPSGAIHEVMPVTRGVRLVCAGWIESEIADASARETLFELENLRITLGEAFPATSPVPLALDKVIGTLIRRWARQ